jgi:cyclic pyranopterin phosphate synthase
VTLPHLTASGDARMVDVAGKEATAREAVATGRLILSAEAVAALRGGTVAKGDALGVARVAGILATKRVPELIPLCHQIALTGADVELDVTDTHVSITVTARTTDRTGVEMEALTGVAVAGLALHDMVKAIDPAAVLTDIRLERKTGGKSGDWARP